MKIGLRRDYWMLLASLLLMWGCARQQVPAETTVAATPPTLPAVEQAPVQVAGLWGKIDDSIVEETFQRHFDELLACYQEEALELLEEIEGRLDVYVIVDKDGHATDDLYFEGGDLGSDATQSCVLGVIRRIQFPKPIGGYHARVRYSFPFEEPYGHPAPFDWSGDELRKVLDEHQQEIDDCLLGETGIGLTLYVGRGGRVVAAGGTASSKEAYAKARCVALAARNWKFPNPGKRRPAKATTTF